MRAAGPLLTVAELAVTFQGEGGPVEILRGVSFDLRAGETLGLVGASGSGKSVTAQAILGLIKRPPLVEMKGRVVFDGEDLVGMTPQKLRQVRGRRIAYIFQEPMSALNPVFTAGDQIAEMVSHHEGLGRRAARARAVDLFAEVGLPDPRRRLGSYPHELSGGQRQRVMIAMALSCNPQLLIADEPTTALDVTVQAQILRLLRRLQRERGMALLFITHDLRVMAEIADRIAVMQAGRIVEDAGVDDLFHRPRHGYTRELLALIPGRRAEKPVPGRGEGEASS
jgi:ABC-type dipeptide/oligopeptide/nickel transport system ATPase component